MAVSTCIDFFRSWILLQPDESWSRDTPKIIRALEVRLETGKTLSEHLAIEPRQPLSGYDIHTIGLNPPREASVQRIDERVRVCLSRGLWMKFVL